VILYLDASAAVKRYLAERGSRETAALVADAELVATSVVSRAEIAAAFAKAVRLRLVTEHVARRAQRAFDRDWLDLLRIPVTEALVDRARTLAWSHPLRGYDAVQLASALTFRESVGTDVLVGTFDAQLSAAALQEGMTAWPANTTAPGPAAATHTPRR
jgi:predicted nucleic acid-binding protein